MGGGMNPFYGLGGEEREEDINSVCCAFGVPGLLIAFVIPKLSWLAMLISLRQLRTLELSRHRRGQ
jgi:hypothetical protein